MQCAYCCLNVKSLPSSGRAEETAKGSPPGRYLGLLPFGMIRWEYSVLAVCSDISAMDAPDVL